jgi:hypothetical protein
MPEYTEIEKVVEVPRGTGIDGYVEMVRSILRKGKVQEVLLRTNGRVSYRRFVRTDEPEDELKVDLSTLMPWHIIRNGDIQELPTPTIETNAAVVISQLFGAVRVDGFKPVAFVTSGESLFWKWHNESTGVVFGKDEAYGLPFFPDPEIPQDVLILCAAFSRDARLVDVRKSYKVTIPRRRPT